MDGEAERRCQLIVEVFTELEQWLNEEGKGPATPGLELADLQSKKLRSAFVAGQRGTSGSANCKLISMHLKSEMATGMERLS
jgi:hypothetical protein